ncbi:hypothetical protein OAE72_02940, partial [Akkermansiaceae bacterium]|nr:hypothetical protein [Akkermansiaceae bacterium]
EELNLPIEVDPLEQLLEQPSHTFEQQADLLSIVTDPARPKPMRIDAFRAALEVTGFTYAEWCVKNLKALAAIETETELYEMLSRDFVQSPPASLLHDPARPEGGVQDETAQARSEGALLRCHLHPRPKPANLGCRP